MKRVRSVVTLDLDEVNPDAIDRAQDFLTEDLDAFADKAGEVVDWGTFQTYIRVSKRKGIFKLVAFARTVR